MKTRDAVLEYQKTLDDVGTLTKDLDITDPVSALYLEFEGTNGSTSNKGNLISDVITKVEIVDGSEVLYSANLFQLEAMHFFKTGKTPTLFPSEWGGGLQRHGCYLLFGRNLYDLIYAQLFTKYKNPQLKISTNIAAITAASATTAFVSGSLKGTIVAKIMEDAPAPGKYLMAKQIDSFTSAASGEIRKEFPVDLPYRMLMLRAYLQQKDIDEVISELKLTCDADKFVVLNRKVRQLDAEALSLFGRATLKHDVFVAHQIAFRELNNKENSSTAQLWENTDGDILGIQYEWSSEGKVTIITNAGAVVSADNKITMMENGHALHACLPVFFGLPNDPATWFDPKAYSKIEAVLTQATASAAVQLLLEQERNVG